MPSPTNDPWLRQRLDDILEQGRLTAAGLERLQIQVHEMQVSAARQETAIASISAAHDKADRALEIATEVRTTMQAHEKMGALKAGGSVAAGGAVGVALSKILAALGLM